MALPRAPMYVAAWIRDVPRSCICQWQPYRYGSPRVPPGTFRPVRYRRIAPMPGCPWHITLNGGN